MLDGPPTPHATLGRHKRGIGISNLTGGIPQAGSSPEWAETAVLAPWSRAAQPCGGIGQVPGSDHLHLFGSWPLSIARFLIAS